MKQSVRARKLAHEEKVRAEWARLLSGAGRPENILHKPGHTEAARQLVDTWPWEETLEV